MVFENVGKMTEVYPCIGMRQTNESIRANFGSSDFQFAIEEHVRAQRDHVWGGIMGTRIDWGLMGLGPRKTEDERKVEETKVVEKPITDDDESRAPLRKLVLAYLAHHGYARTARAFQTQCAERVKATSDTILVKPKTELTDDDVNMTDDNDALAVSSVPRAPRAEYDNEFGFDYELNNRLSITNSILRGDIDSALRLIRDNHATVLEREQGLVNFRLRCRKFVELVLQAGEALRQVKEAERSMTPKGTTERVLDGAGDDIVGTMDGVGAMDVDDPSLEAPPVPSSPAVSSPTAHAPSASTAPPPAASPVQNARATLQAIARTSLHTALSYGQMLETDYKNDMRPGVRAHLRRTFGVVAFEDPVAEGGEVAEIAGQAARDALAAEVNQAILGESGSLFLLRV